MSGSIDSLPSAIVETLMVHLSPASLKHFASTCHRTMSFYLQSDGFFWDTIARRWCEGEYDGCSSRTRALDILKSRQLSRLKFNRILPAVNRSVGFLGNRPFCCPDEPLVNIPDSGCVFRLTDPGGISKGFWHLSPVLSGKHKRNSDMSFRVFRVFFLDEKRVLIAGMSRGRRYVVTHASLRADGSMYELDWWINISALNIDLLPVQTSRFPACFAVPASLPYIGVFTTQHPSRPTLLLKTGDMDVLALAQLNENTILAGGPEPWVVAWHVGKPLALAGGAGTADEKSEARRDDGGSLVVDPALTIDLPDFNSTRYLIGVSMSCRRRCPNCKCANSIGCLHFTGDDADRVAVAAGTEEWCAVLYSRQSAPPAEAGRTFFGAAAAAGGGGVGVHYIQFPARTDLLAACPLVHSRGVLVAAALRSGQFVTAVVRRKGADRAAGVSGGGGVLTVSSQCVTPPELSPRSGLPRTGYLDLKVSTLRGGLFQPSGNKDVLEIDLLLAYKERVLLRRIFHQDCRTNVHRQSFHNRKLGQQEHAQGAPVLTATLADHGSDHAYVFHIMCLGCAAGDNGVVLAERLTGSVGLTEGNMWLLRPPT